MNWKLTRESNKSLSAFISFYAEFSSPLLLLLSFEIDNLSWDGIYEESEDITIEFDTDDWLLVLLF